MSYFSNSGKKEETINTNKPITNTVMVLEEHPFHSFKMIPHTFENVTLSDIRIHQENVSNAGEEVRNPLPKLKPKNWLYQRIPANAQNNRLLPYKAVLP